ncbi:MAG: tetratricopeptide repeat protein [Rhodothermaceae bacterium]|nr:tetratricopeptide repeat protein [Rhodothermaceae bacterium]
MAEINLGMNGVECDRSRILEGIEVIKKAVDGGVYSPGAMLYCVANGWLALNKYERAVKAYRLALGVLIEAGLTEVVAQCYKNLGSTMNKLNKPHKARYFYKRALEYDAELAEAHFALALWNRRNGDFKTALSYLEEIIWPQGSAGTSANVSGWRAECLFELGKIKEAIREIISLLSMADKPDWVWPWCAKLVAKYGNVSQDASEFSIRFWDRYLKQNAGDTRAQIQRLLSVWYLYSNFDKAIWSYQEFKQNVVDITNDGISNPEFLWHLVGLWAQKEENWTEAEEWYRKAYDHFPEEYGYYLGTALNQIGRYEEALQILLSQAEKYYPDELSWFQVAIAMGGVGNTEGCIDAYERVLKLDETYAKAWFNLGGIYWNSGQMVKAKKVWAEAIRRFPEHELTERLKNDLPGVFGP